MKKIKKKTVGILAASVAVGALCVVTDVPALAKGGGGPPHGGGGGGGGHGGGFAIHGGGGGGHGFGGFHGLAIGGGGHGFGGFHGLGIGGGAPHLGHGLSFGHAFGAHGFSAHALHTHGISHYAGHGISHYAGHGVSHQPSHYAGHGVSHYAGHAGHNVNHAHTLAGNSHRFGARGVTHTTHNQLAGHNAQFAHNNAPNHDQITHNEFAARNFHGLNNFNRTGFNRNAFGNSGDWNNWGGNFWGAGWNNWGGGWGGWAGPVFWPFVLGDVLSFVLWPYTYYDPFWLYGPPFIFASIFAPGPYFGLDYGYGPDYYGYASGYGGYANSGSPNIYYNYAGGRRVATTNQSDQQALSQVNTEAVQSCAGLAPGVTNLPIDQIRQTIHPTGDQQSALDELGAAATRASDIIQSSCPSTMPLTPIGRLDTAEQRLDGTIKAIDVIRTPLARFYDLLSDQQKQQFNAMNGSAAQAGQPAGKQSALCSAQGGSVVDLPVQRIEQVVQPTVQQQNALEALKQATQHAADQLQASCPNAVPQSPVARLDSVETRLKAMIGAIASVRPALENFYASLNDEQKARFNMMGPPTQAASAQPQGRSSGR
jgi:LTXXQ motif family protein